MTQPMADPRAEAEADNKAQTSNEIPTVTTSLSAPTVFADGVWLASIMGDVVRMQFIENQLEPTNSTEPGWRARHVGTIVMPRTGFKSMVKYLNDMDKFFDGMDAAIKANGEA